MKTNFNTNNKTVTLFDIHSVSINPPEGLVEHIEWLQSLLDKIPEEFRGDAIVEIDAYYETINYSVSYDRPETPDEAEEASKLAAKCDEDHRQKELYILASLKAKYPNS